MAFQMLYSLSFSPATSLASLEQAWEAFPRRPEKSQNDAPLERDAFAWKLIRGVWENERRLDTELARVSRNWRLDRIGRIELILLRLGLFEIMEVGTPVKAAINEVLDLAAQFGVGDARGFINGVLDGAARSLGQSFPAGMGGSKISQDGGL